MSEPQRDLKRDLLAIALFALVVFLGVALFTYSPADPHVELVQPLDSIVASGNVEWPVSTEVQNACGRWGTLAAEMLLQSIGVGAYFVVISIALLDVILLRRQPLDAPLLRWSGWLLTLVGISTFAASFPWQSLPFVSANYAFGPVTGAGGYLGLVGREVLESHFATGGVCILAVSFVLAGMLLCTEYALFIASAASATWVKERASGVKQKLHQEDESETDDEELEAEVSLHGPAIRIGGKKSASRPLDELEDDEEMELQPAAELTAEEDEEAVSEDEQDTAAQTLKVRKPKKKRKVDETSEREQVYAQLDDGVTDEMADYQLPDLDMLIESEEVEFDEQEKEVRRKAKILERTFGEFGFNVKVVEIDTGPVIAQYEVQLEAGLRLSKITGLADDLAIALRVPSVRIVAPIPGKNTVGIEVPNENRQVVRLREVMEEADADPKYKKMRIPIFLGKDVSGNALTADLSSLPHLLIAGRTGTGKSVCLNAIITSILMTRRPDEVRLLMIDPKMVELSGYARLPHLMHPVVTDMKKAEAILAWAVDKMEERYQLLAKAGVRHLTSYNQLGEEELYDRLQPESEEEKEMIPKHLPFIVIVADEMADLMMQCGKDVEQHIIRLAQKSRAVGIHLILATQKPTVDVITGLIKSNLPARLSFQVASRTDSRVVLDEMGAEKLLGNGDMLFLWPGTSTLLRGQGTYLSDDEIDSVTACVSTGEQNFVSELVNLKVESEDDGDSADMDSIRKRDDLYESAVDVVVREGRGSVSLLQRALGIGYGRAARLIDFMAEDGIVGEYAGSQAREVTISPEEWEAMQAGNEDSEAEPLPLNKTKPKRSHRIRLQEAEPEGEPDDESEEYQEEESAADDDTEAEYEEEEYDADQWEEGEYEESA
jgi:S-DNA-T family DNA segregation ATPase FtsK/SpoIIIE